MTWEPRFTFHGFRYAEIEGWPGEFDPADFTAVVLAHATCPARDGSPRSHELLDRLHENVVWGMRGNFLSIPTDCPQRDERLGWTGDIQVFAPTASLPLRLRRVPRVVAARPRARAAPRARRRAARRARGPSVLRHRRAHRRMGRRGDRRALGAPRALRRRGRAARRVRQHARLGRRRPRGHRAPPASGPVRCSSATGSTPTRRPTSPTRRRSTATSWPPPTSPARCGSSPMPPRCSARPTMPSTTRPSPSAPARRSSPSTSRPPAA